jgi:hypothetical protein
MGLLAAPLLGLLLAAPVHGEIAIRVAGAQVDLTATAAPLADVLDRLARQTGMKVVYEGPAPRQLVTLSVRGRTPVETVFTLLEGQGLNYALEADASGAGVQTLLLAGATTASLSTSGRRAAPVPTRPRRPFGPPPGSSPETVEPPFDETDDEPPEEVPFPGVPPATPENEPAGAAEAAPPGSSAPADAAPHPNTPALPLVPPQTFPVSPFAPQPQPFPPLPPGVPGGPPADGGQGTQESSPPGAPPG